jgi:hypothetical protein
VKSEWRPAFDDVKDVGRHGLTDELRARLDGMAEIGHLGAAEWEKLVAAQPEADCWDLLRGFVTLEEQMGLGGGSVAAGNLLARAFVQRFTHRWQEAVAWLRENAKSNSWYFTKHSPLAFDTPEQWSRFIEAERQRTR